MGTYRAFDLPHSLRILLASAALAFCWFVATMLLGPDAASAAEPEPQEPATSSIVGTAISPIAPAVAALPPALEPLPDAAAALLAPADAAITPVATVAEATLSAVLDTPVRIVDEVVEQAAPPAPTPIAAPVATELLVPAPPTELSPAEAEAAPRLSVARGTAVAAAQPAVPSAIDAHLAPGAPSHPSAPLAPAAALPPAAPAPTSAPTNSTDTAGWLLPTPAVADVPITRADDSLPSSPDVDGTSTPD